MTEQGEQAPRTAAPSSCVVGRDEELASVVELLRSGARIVTLVGPTGVGKSKIAHALADASLEKDVTYVVVARLGGVTDPSVARDEILRALPEPAGLAGLATSPGEALWERCQGAEVLLVLDDVEVGAGLVPVVLETTAGYPAVRVLATSLRPLGVSGEQVVRIRPFPPEPDSWVTASGEVSPGVAVFVERPGPPTHGSRSARTTSRMWPRSVGPSGACRWRSSWRRRG